MRLTLLTRANCQVSGPSASQPGISILTLLEQQLYPEYTTIPQTLFGMTISSYYQGKVIDIGNAKVAFAWGACLSNIGPKMRYNDTVPAYFLPTNLRIGPSLTIDIDNYNKLSFLFDFK